MSNAVNSSQNFFLAVPSDTTVLPSHRLRRIVCLTAGNLVAQNSSSVSVTIAMVAGQSIEMAPTKIMAATTGTYLVLA